MSSARRQHAIVEELRHCSSSLITTFPHHSSIPPRPPKFSSLEVCSTTLASPSLLCATPSQCIPPAAAPSSPCPLSPPDAPLPLSPPPLLYATPSLLKHPALLPCCVQTSSLLDLRRLSCRQRRALHLARPSTTGANPGSCAPRGLHQQDGTTLG